jgi:hypothetical protein
LHQKAVQLSFSIKSTLFVKFNCNAEVHLVEFFSRFINNFKNQCVVENRAVSLIFAQLLAVGYEYVPVQCRGYQMFATLCSLTRTRQL